MDSHSASAEVKSVTVRGLGNIFQQHLQALRFISQTVVKSDIIKQKKKRETEKKVKISPSISLNRMEQESTTCTQYIVS